MVHRNLKLEGPARRPGVLPDPHAGAGGRLGECRSATEDDYIPFLFPWYGTGVLACVLGAEILFQAKMDPAVQGTVVNRPEEVRQLSLPDPREDGLMPRVLETIRFFRAHSRTCRSPSPIPKARSPRR